MARVSGCPLVACLAYLLGEMMTNCEKEDLERYLKELGDWFEIMSRGGGAFMGSLVRGASWDQVSHGQRDQANAPVIVTASVERSLRALDAMGQYDREVLLEKHYNQLPEKQGRKELKMARTTWWRHVAKAESEFMRARRDIGDQSMQAPARVQIDVDINKPFAPETADSIPPANPRQC